MQGLKVLRAPYVFMSDHSILPSVKREDDEYRLELFWEHSPY